MDGVPFSLRVDPFYCQPGLKGAHEKGGVEGQIGWFRRNHLVPVPEVESFEQLNAMADAWDAADDARRIGSRAHTVGELFAIEQPLLVPLPNEPFETGTWLGAPRRPLPPCHRLHQPLLHAGAAGRPAGPGPPAPATTSLRSRSRALPRRWPSYAPIRPSESQPATPSTHRERGSQTQQH